MHDLAGKLKYAAIDVVNGFQRRRKTLEANLKEAQLRVLEIQATLDGAKLAIDRFNSFTPDIGGNLQCPRCWIANGRRADMIAVAGEPNSETDIFQCRECHFEFSTG